MKIQIGIYRSARALALSVATGITLAGFSAGATAGLVWADFDGFNDCAGFFGGTAGTTCTISVLDDQGAKIELSPIIAKYNTAGDSDPGGWETYSYYPTVDGSEFSFAPNDPPVNSDKSGTWTYAPDDPEDPEVLYWTVKASNAFRLYWYVNDDPAACAASGSDYNDDPTAYNLACLQLALAQTTNSWSTVGGVFGDTGKGLSHIAFWNHGASGTSEASGETPAPGTLGLLGAGLVAGLFNLRRRKVLAA